MDKPTTREMLLATTWLEHHGSTWAWEELNDLIRADPNAAWKMVQVMVAFGPDYGTLAAVAAGPVEDLLSDNENFEPMRREAERSFRFRICLRAAYGLPHDLQRYTDEVLPDEPLPPSVDTPVPSADQVALMVAWFHHSDTDWARTFLDEQIRDDPGGAWTIVRLLLRLSDDTPERREDVFLFAVEPFIRRHLDTYRTELIDVARRRQELRSWLIATKRPLVENHDGWKEFVDAISSA